MTLKFKGMVMILSQVSSYSIAKTEDEDLGDSIMCMMLVSV